MFWELITSVFLIVLTIITIFYLISEAETEAERSDTVPPGTVSLASGYGNDGNISGPSDVLRSVNVPVVDHKQCNNGFNVTITDRMLCARVRSGVCKVIESIDA
jgi:Trypsin